MAGESLRQGGTIFIRAIRRSYVNLGLIIALSLLWFALAALPASFMVNFAIHVPSIISFIIVAIFLTFISGPVTAAVYGVANMLIHDEEVGITSLWPQFRSHYKLSAQVTAAMSFILIVLVVDIIVFVQSKVRFVQWFAVLWPYFVVFWLLMTSYIYPLVVHKNTSWLRILQRAALLVLDNLVVSVLVLLELVVIVAFSAFFILPVPVYIGGAMALLHVTTLELVLQKYESGTVSKEND